MYIPENFQETNTKRIQTKQIIRESVRESSAGRLHFGEVIQRMMQAGVESYFADYRAERTTYYLTNDESFSLDLESPEVEIAQEFNCDGIKAAIFGAQLRY